MEFLGSYVLSTYIYIYIYIYTKFSVENTNFIIVLDLPYTDRGHSTCKLTGNFSYYMKLDKA
jgi:hypothetical protein